MKNINSIGKLNTYIGECTANKLSAQNRVNELTKEINNLSEVFSHSSITDNGISESELINKLDVI